MTAPASVTATDPASADVAGIRIESNLVLDALPALVSYINRDYRYCLCNLAYENWFGRTRAEVVGRTMSDILGESAFQIVKPRVDAALAGERVSWATRIPYRDAGERDVHIDYIPDREVDGGVRGFFVLVLDVREQKLAEQRLDDANAALREREVMLATETEALTKLNDASSRLWRLSNLQEGLEEILNATIELLAADRGTIQLLDDERQILSIVAQRGFEAPFLDFFRAVSTADNSACGRTLRAKARTVIEDVETDEPYEPFRPIARAAGYRSVQSTPLIGRRGTPIGMLSTHWRRPHHPSVHDLRRLDLYARQASDFIERCASDEALRNSEAALREADVRKDAFLATLSHELRNPLAPIRQSIAVLKRPNISAAASQQAREVLDRQSQHMSLLLDDLLDVTRISRGTLSLRKAPVRLGDIVAAAVEVATKTIQSQRHELLVEIEPESLTIDADAVRLSQVVSNLLLNAAKYTDPGGKIRLQAKADGDSVTFSVVDNGMGIGSEVLPRVFDMFTQAPAAIGRSQGGLGVGLALVRAIVELHGGTVQVRSAGIGRGSEFVVQLPLRAPAVDQLAEPAIPQPMAEMRPLRVVLADDNVDAVETLRMLLVMEGHAVQVCHDGQQALEAIESSQPDVAVLDIGMPRLNGLEVAEKARTAVWGRDVTLIALSGWGQKEDQQRAAASGFTHHLTKPVDFEVLQALIVKARSPGSSA